MTVGVEEGVGVRVRAAVSVTVAEWEGVEVLVRVGVEVRVEVDVFVGVRVFVGVGEDKSAQRTVPPIASIGFAPSEIVKRSPSIPTPNVGLMLEETNSNLIVSPSVHARSSAKRYRTTDPSSPNETAEKLNPLLENCWDVMTWAMLPIGSPGKREDPPRLIWPPRSPESETAME